MCARALFPLIQVAPLSHLNTLMLYVLLFLPPPFHFTTIYLNCKSTSSAVIKQFLWLFSTSETGAGVAGDAEAPHRSALKNAAHCDQTLISMGLWAAGPHGCKCLQDHIHRSSNGVTFLLHCHTHTRHCYSTVSCVSECFLIYRHAPVSTD